MQDHIESVREQYQEGLINFYETVQWCLQYTDNIEGLCEMLKITPLELVILLTTEASMLSAR